ncbi:MAG: hypothetical protein QXS16_03685 [Pyrobaculum sp.]
MTDILRILNTIPKQPVIPIGIVIESHRKKAYLKILENKYEFASPLTFAPTTIELIVYTEIDGWQDVLKSIPKFYEKKDVKINGNTRFYVFSYKQEEKQ